MILSLLLSLAFANEPLGLRCPMGIGSLEGDAPKMSNQYQPGKYIFICGFNEDESSESAIEPSGPIMMNGFEIYSFSDGAKSPQRLRTIAALEKHEVERTGEGLAFSEIVRIGKSELKTLKIEVKCRDGECKIEKPTCLFKRLKDIPTAQFREFKRHYNGTKKDKIPNEATVEGAAKFALTGDAEAVELYLKSPPPVRLEGGTKEIFGRYSELIKRLRDNRCL